MSAYETAEWIWLRDHDPGDIPEPVTRYYACDICGGMIGPGEPLYRSKDTERISCGCEAGYMLDEDASRDWRAEAEAGFAEWRIGDI